MTNILKRKPRPHRIGINRAMERIEADIIRTIRALYAHHVSTRAIPSPPPNLAYDLDPESGWPVPRYPSEFFS